MGAFRNLSGLRFGRLVVLCISHRDRFNHIWWVCQCDCKTRKTIVYSSLTTGMTKSCGCFRREVLKQLRTTHGQSATRHGQQPSSEYHIWRNMIRRCYDPTNKRYKRYGARGIKVCKSWRHSFEMFFADMGPRPKGKTKNGRALYSIDRINNSQGYKPNNCRWATILEQAQNRR